MSKACSEMVVPSGRYGSFRTHQCSREGSVVRDGKSYCKQHDPDAREKRRKAADEKWNEKWAVESAKELRKSLILKICEDMSADEVLRAIEKWKSA